MPEIKAQSLEELGCLGFKDLGVQIPSQKWGRFLGFRA